MLKNKLVQNIVAPVATSHSAISLDALVIDANQRTGKCTIEYVNSRGVKVVQENVFVKNISLEMFVWFPKKNEKVIISVRNNDIMITGPSISKSNSGRLKLEHDIFSDNTSAGIGGSIF